MLPLDCAIRRNATCGAQSYHNRNGRKVFVTVSATQWDLNLNSGARGLDPTRLAPPVLRPSKWEFAAPRVHAGSVASDRNVLAAMDTPTTTVAECLRRSSVASRGRCAGVWKPVRRLRSRWLRLRESAFRWRLFRTTWVAVRIHERASTQTQTQHDDADEDEQSHIPLHQVHHPWELEAVLRVRTLRRRLTGPRVPGVGRHHAVHRDARH